MAATTAPSSPAIWPDRGCRWGCSSAPVDWAVARPLSTGLRLAQHRHPRAARVLRRRRQPRTRSPAAPLLGPERPRSLRDSIRGGDLPRRLVATHVRAHLVRHVVGSQPGTRRQARHRRRGVRRTDPPLRQESMARHREALQPATHRALVALRAEHDARQRDRDAIVRSARHLQRAPRHDGRRVLRRFHHRLATGPLPTDPPNCRATRCCSTTSTTARRTCTPAVGSAVARRSTAGTPSPPTSRSP